MARSPSVPSGISANCQSCVLGQHQFYAQPFSCSAIFPVCQISPRPPSMVASAKALNIPSTRLTVALHSLVDESVQQGAAVVAEGRAGVRVDFELVLAPWVLEGGGEVCHN